MFSKLGNFIDKCVDKGMEMARSLARVANRKLNEEDKPKG